MRVTFKVWNTGDGRSVGPLEMSAVPREGEYVEIEDHFSGEVKSVAYLLHALDWSEPSVDVIVRVRV
jgi:hypothetical protein